MGNCNSCTRQTSQLLDMYLKNIDPNNMDQLKNVLIQLWNIYELLSQPDQKRLDQLAIKVGQQNNPENNSEKK